jgi:hypothetical protein
VEKGNIYKVVEFYEEIMLNFQWKII